MQYPRFTAMIVSAGMLLLSACSNPFAGHSDQAAAPKNEFHTKTENCNRINLSEEHLSQIQLRNVVGCLNSNQEIDALDRLLRSMPDNEIKPLVDLLNSTTDLNPTVFYAAKEMYLRVRNDGRLLELEKILGDLLQDAKKNESVAQALGSLAPVIRELIQTQSLSLSTENLDTLASSASFQRFVLEYNDPKLLPKFAASVKTYLADPTATSIETLYQVLSENPVSEAFAEFSGDPKKLQDLASFLEWVFSDNRYEAFSNTLLKIRTEKMTCFGGKIEIKTPLETELKELAHMTSAEAKKYFNHDLKNLILTSRGYCDIPYSIDGFTKFLDEATLQPGYAEIFSLLRPLMLDDRFISFLASPAAKNWMKENGYLADQHFFQDLLTLIAQTQRAPLSSDGKTIAHILDRGLNGLNAKQVEDLVLFLSPALGKEQKYGYQPIHLIHSLVEEFPSLKTRSQPGLRDSMAVFAETVLQKKELGGLLTLTGSLIRDQKLNPIIDQTLIIFQNFLNRGKSNLDYGSLKLARRSGSDLVNWLLEKQAFALPAIDACRNLVYDWNFTEFNAQNPAAYVSQLDLIAACVNTNQTFKTARDLATHLISSGQMNYLLKTQKSVVDEIYQLDTPLVFKTLDQFLDLNTEQSMTVRKTLMTGSNLLKEAVSLVKKKELREFVSHQLNEPGVYETVSEYLKSPNLPSVEAPSLDLMALDKINVQVDRSLYFNNEPFVSAVDKLFKMYCPTLNIEDASCDLDEDQVATFIKSPEALVKEVKTEYLASSQNWLHPKLFKGWNHTHAPVQQVSDFEYHLNPVLHQVRNGSNSVNGVFNAVERIQSHHYDLNRFLKDRALRLTLIPYIYQVPDYPKAGSREFHTRMRIRIASDLDRLELLAINADFKAFGLVQNMGLGFIREIGLSWADLPQSEWPKSLAQMKPAENIRTLKEAKDYINSEMNRFDKGIIQRLGNCDPRGRGRISRWFQRAVCSNELSDISSRLFNLRFLITLLDRELLEKDNSSGGLSLLRDLFYSFYESNTLAQFDQFGNGVDVGDECLKSPSLSADPVALCHKDNLAIIPKITRMGLLHQAGMAILKNQNTSTRSLVNTVTKLGSQKKITQKLAEFATSAQGLKTVEAGVDFGFESGPKISDALAASVPLLDLIPNQNWVSALVDLVRQYPEVLHDHQAVIEAALSGDGSLLKSITTQINSQPNAKALSWINDLSLKLSDPLITELAGSMRELKPQASRMAPIIRSFYQLPPLHSDELTLTLAQWSDTLASEKGKLTRMRLSNWVKGSEFETFCDVFSDSSFVDKTYNFLEEVHQNPDSRDFFQSCKNFMNVR